MTVTDRNDAVPVERTDDTYQHPYARSVRPRRRRRPVRRTGDLVTGLGPTIAMSNVIMQLANRKVGYGVLESRVDSGNAVKHPVKRSRTTGTFLAVALLGDDRDRAFVHEELRHVHDQVFSTESSPVRYSGNDARLQLWVAVCLLKYFIDQYELLHGPLTPAERERVVDDGRWLGTTLNVDDEHWPASYADLLTYWRTELASISIDPPVRQLLQGLSDLSLLSVRFGAAGSALHHLLGGTTSYLIRAGLPPQFRSAMGWEWSAHDEWFYERALDALRLADPALGRVTRGLMSVYLVDMRLRRRLGLSVF